MPLKVWPVGLKREEEANQTLRRFTVTAYQCRPVSWHSPSLPRCHCLTVQTCMQGKTARTPWLSGFYGDWLCRAASFTVCVPVTLTHTNRDSFPHRVTLAFILGPGLSWVNKHAHTHTMAHSRCGWRCEDSASVWVCTVFTILPPAAWSVFRTKTTTPFFT